MLNVMKKSAFCMLTTGLLLTGSPSFAWSPGHTQQVEMHAVTVQGEGKYLGVITLKDTPQGLRITPRLTNLPAGNHGFHVHEKGSCAPAMKEDKMVAALAAGGHFNPTGVAHGTAMTGHMGDLPSLNVNAQGKATTTVIAPRLKLKDIHGLALMIHAGGDNYADSPKPAGGGGERIACGVLQDPEVVQNFDPFDY